MPILRPWNTSSGARKMSSEPRRAAKKKPYRKRRKSPKRFGICLDSLLQVGREDGYELIIIDESQQVFGHLFSETVVSRGDQERIYKLFREHVRRAKSVIALDADLDFLTHTTLARMVSGPDG